MKKMILSALMVATAVASVNAQDAKKNNDGGVYVRVGVGYALQQAGDLNSGNETYSATSSTYDYKKGSYGAGFNGILAGGYMFNQHIGLELGVGVGIAMKKLVTETDYNVPGVSFNGSDNFTSTSTSYAKMPILIMPAVVLTTGNTGLEGYGRLGLVLPVAGKIINEYEMTDRSGTGTFNRTMEFTPSFSLGFQGALGARYHVSDMFNIWAEINGISASAYVKKSEITTYEVNGVSELGNLTIAGRETEYEMNYTENGSGTASTPSKASAFSVPFSNVGLSIGVGFRF